MRRLTLSVGAEQEGKTIQTLLRRELSLSAAGVRRAKGRGDGILLDGRPVFTNAVAHLGQTLTVAVGGRAGQPSDRPGLRPLDIRYEDEDLLVVDKVGGMPVHQPGPPRGHPGERSHGPLRLPGFGGRLPPGEPAGPGDLWPHGGGQARPRP